MAISVLTLQRHVRGWLTRKRLQERQKQLAREFQKGQMEKENQRKQQRAGTIYINLFIILKYTYSFHNIFYYYLSIYNKILIYLYYYGRYRGKVKKQETHIIVLTFC